MTLLDQQHGHTPMIERLQRAVRWFQAAVVAAIALASENMLKLLHDRLHDRFFASAIVLVVAVVAFKASEAFAEWAIDQSRWLRKRILADHFIEGYWIDKVQGVAADEALDVYAIIKIKCERGRYEVSGESFDGTGEPLGNFRCYTSSYSDFQLRYAYEGINSRHPESKVEGYGEYHFTPGRVVPVTFSGFIYDSYHAKRVNLRANKISNRDLLASIDEQVTRKRVIQAFAEGNLQELAKPRPA